MQRYKKQWNATLVKSLQLHLYSNQAHCVYAHTITKRVQILTNTAGVKLWST